MCRSSDKTFCVCQVAGEFPSVEIFPHVKVTSLHGCTVRLTAIHLAPDVITEQRISEETGQWAQHVEHTQILKHRYLLQYNSPYVVAQSVGSACRAHTATC